MNEGDSIIYNPKWRKILRPLLCLLDYFANSKWYTTYSFEQKLIHWYNELYYYIYGVDEYVNYGRRAIVPKAFVDIYKSHPLLNDLYRNAQKINIVE